MTREHFDRTSNSHHLKASGAASEHAYTRETEAITRTIEQCIAIVQRSGSVRQAVADLETFRDG